MGFGTVNSLLLVIVIALVFLAAFCYDLACSANSIRPGEGGTMMSISMASGLMTVLTGLNLALLNRERIFRGQPVRAPAPPARSKPKTPARKTGGKAARRAKPRKGKRRGKK